MCIGGSLEPEGGREPVSNMCRNFLISIFCMSIILFFSSISFSISALGVLMVNAARVAVSPLLFLLWSPRAASRSWIWVRAIFSSFRKSLISLIRDTFSCKTKETMSVYKDNASIIFYKHTKIYDPCH